jgi:DNA-binding GntR family transcriptional regulator
MKLINLPKKTGDIFFLLLEYIGYNNQVVINSSIKRIISDKLNIKFDTVNKAITVLNANGLLIRQDTGIYLVNPYYVGKGSWNDITKLRITCEYSKELGREIKYEQEY